MQMKTYSLTIPKPCHQGWDDMIPNDEGRYCLSCAKTVTDFSVMTDEAIQQYFINNGGQPVCGRFKKTQLERIRIQVPGYFFHKKTATWKKFLVIFLICFGSNFFSIDILLGDSKALYAQTQANAPGNKKAKKFHVKKVKRLRWQFKPVLIEPIRTFDVVFGGLGLEHAPAYYPPWNEPGLACNIDTPAKNDSTTSLSVAGDISSGNNKQPEKEQVPPQPAEFILPAILRLRRRAGKKAW